MMRHQGRTYLSLLTLLFVQVSFAQAKRKHLREGNRAYTDGKYREAEISFRRGLEKKPGSDQAIFNLGNSLYQQEAFHEAAQQYARAGDLGDDRLTEAKAYHNIGNAHVRGGKLQEALEAYKQALRLNPNDEDTRFNLAWVQARMQQGQEDQQNQDQQEGDDQQEQQQSSNQQEQQGQQEQKQQQAREEQISKEDAERMLQALKNDEQKTLDKVKKQLIPAERRRIEKDW